MAPALMSVHSADVSMTRCSSALERLVRDCLTAVPHFFIKRSLYKQQMRKVTVSVTVMTLGILAVEMMTSKPGRSLENFDHDLECVVG